MRFSLASTILTIGLTAFLPLIVGWRVWVATGCLVLGGSFALGILSPRLVRLLGPRSRIRKDLARPATVGVLLGAGLGVVGETAGRMLVDSTQVWPALFLPAALGLTSGSLVVLLASTVWRPTRPRWGVAS